VLTPARTDAAFYAVMPHAVMVAIFGGAGTFVLIALSVSLGRFWREIGGADSGRVPLRALAGAIRDGVTLRHLHASGPDCASAEEVRTPWRRVWHHFTLGGFILCFASTSVAALYHTVFGWEAPYAYASLPVVLGLLGGAGLAIGPLGQWRERRRRDPALGDAAQRGLDDALIVLLWLASVTGLLLLGLRARPIMGLLLMVHLGVVLALFVSLPYGKFVHGFYRLLALAKDAAEQSPPR
jgi:citrate/tricarballylate utilization protein